MTFREISLYCEMQSIKVLEELKQEIQVQEAVTDKLIGASMVNEKPKIISLKSMFTKLFPQTNKAIQTADEIKKTMRAAMRAEENE